MRRLPLSWRPPGPPGRLGHHRRDVQFASMIPGANISASPAKDAACGGMAHEPMFE